MLSLLIKRGLSTNSLAQACIQQLSSLVLVEHNGCGKICSATLPAITAAAKIGGDVTAMAAGADVQSVAESAAKLAGVSQVMMVQLPQLEHQLPEIHADVIASIQKQKAFSHIVCSSSTFGRNVMPRVAGLLGVQQVSDITDIINPNTFVRPIYAGKAMSKVKFTSEGTRIVTVRATSFPSLEEVSKPPCTIQDVQPEDLDLNSDWGERVQWLGTEKSNSDRPELGSARIVVSGGRALKTQESFKMIERLSDKLGGAVGASRAAVDAGLAPNDLQVGQTGKTVAPDLYIAIGISGAIQHLGGITDSKFIVAINSDPEAPIFQVADYGLVQDLFVALPELEEAIDDINS